MKRKYYKYTDSYCRHLRAVTCVPIRFKLPDMRGRYCIRNVSDTQVALEGWVPCDGRTLPEVSKVFRDVMERATMAPLKRGER